LVVAEMDRRYPYFSTSARDTVPFPAPENPEITTSVPLLSVIFFLFLSILRFFTPYRYGLWRQRRQHDMSALHHKRRPRPPPAGGIHRHPLVPGILDHPLNRIGVPTHHGDDLLSVYHISESDVDQLCHTLSIILCSAPVPESSLSLSSDRSPCWRR